MRGNLYRLAFSYALRHNLDTVLGEGTRTHCLISRPCRIHFATFGVQQIPDAISTALLLAIAHTAGRAVARDYGGVRIARPLVVVIVDTPALWQRLARRVGPATPCEAWAGSKAVFFERADVGLVRWFGCLETLMLDLTYVSVAYEVHKRLFVTAPTWANVAYRSVVETLVAREAGGRIIVDPSSAPEISSRVNCRRALARLHATPQDGDWDTLCAFGHQLASFLTADRRAWLWFCRLVAGVYRNLEERIAALHQATGLSPEEIDTRLRASIKASQ